MKIINALRFIVAFWFLGMSGVVATAQIQPGQNQQERNITYPDEKLQKFVDASRDISTIHQQGEEKMIKVIERENLDIETFNQIAEMKMNPGESTPIGVTNEQVESFDRVMPELQIIQMQMQQDMESAIEDSGMKVEEYTEIMEAYRTDPKVQGKINELLLK